MGPVLASLDTDASQRLQSGHSWFTPELVP